MKCWFRAITTTTTEKKLTRRKGSVKRARFFFLYKNNNHHHDDKYWSARKWDRVRRDRRGRNATRHNHHYCYFIIAIFDFENRLIARLKVDIDHTQTNERAHTQTAKPTEIICLHRYWFVGALQRFFSRVNLFITHRQALEWENSRAILAKVWSERARVRAKAKWLCTAFICGKRK